MPTGVDLLNKAKELGKIVSMLTQEEIKMLEG